MTPNPTPETQSAEPDRFIIELENIAPGHRTIMADPPGPVTLDFAAGTTRAPSRLPVTAEQFRLFRYDIRLRTQGLHGTDRDFVLWAVNLRTGERQQISYEQAEQALGVIDSAAAEALQKAKAEEAKAARKAQAEATGGGMRSAAATAMAAAQAGSTPAAAPIDLGDVKS